MHYHWLKLVVKVAWIVSGVVYATSSTLDAKSTGKRYCYHNYSCDKNFKS